MGCERKKLPFDQKMRLYNRVRELRLYFDSRPTGAQAVEEMSKDLGFPVTEHHVTRACKEQRVQWKKTRVVRNPRQKKDRLLVLARALIRLYMAVDFAPHLPEELLDLERQLSPQSVGA